MIESRRYDPGPPPSRGEGVACSVRTQCKVLVYQFTRAFLHVSMPHGQNTLFFFALLTIVIFRGALHQVQPSATTPLGDPCGMGVGVWNDVDGPQCTTQVSRPPPPSHPWEGREVALVSRGTTVPLSHRIPPWLLGRPTGCPPLAGFLNPPPSAPTQRVDDKPPHPRVEDSLLKRRTHACTWTYPPAYSFSLYGAPPPLPPSSSCVG